MNKLDEFKSNVDENPLTSFDGRPVEENSESSSAYRSETENSWSCVYFYPISQRLSYAFNGLVFKIKIEHIAFNTTCYLKLIMSNSEVCRKLTYEQVSRLEQVVGSSFSVHGIGNYPTLTLKARELVVSVRDRLEEVGFTLKDIRINGSAASCIVGGDKCRTYNDLDILFNLSSVTFPETERTRHDRIKMAVLTSLVDFFPECTDRLRLNLENVGDAYLQKMVKVQNGHDSWSLMALRNCSGRNIELKFVDTMRRKYEFSIDSFQVIIDDFLTFVETSPVPMSKQFFPTVFVESVYGNFDAALHHLENNLIATNNPEEIRGGGLLKYCFLRACNFKDAEPSMTGLKKYMCSRFFIDFPDEIRQRMQLQNYLTNHFIDREDLKNPFLVQVLTVVQHNANCLPMHERCRTLNMIHEMACAFAQQMRPSYPKHPEFNIYDYQTKRSPSHMYGQFIPVTYPLFYATPVISQNISISWCLKRCDRTFQYLPAPSWPVVARILTQTAGVWGYSLYSIVSPFVYAFVDIFKQINTIQIQFEFVRSSFGRNANDQCIIFQH